MPLPNPKNFALGSAAADLGFDMRMGEENLLDEEERRKRLREKREGQPNLFGDSVLGQAASELWGIAGTALNSNRKVV